MTRIDEIRANLARGIVGMPSDAVVVAQDLLTELDRTTADLAVAVEVARERGEEIERLSRRLGMTRDNAADDLAELRAENERLRAVADAAGELTYCIGNAGSADIDRAALAVDAALDALDAGGEES